MKVFSKEKFIEVEGYETYLLAKRWVDVMDGKRVIDGYVGDYSSHYLWEVEREDAK